jgi:DNA-binding NtrC family response regulator
MRILLVEDTQMLAESIISLLERKGAEIVHVTNVSAACKLLREQEFDLLISDYSLGPQEKGDAVLRVALEVAPKMRRVLMSGEEEAAWTAKEGLAHVFYIKDSKLAKLLMAEAGALEAMEV